MTVLSNEELKRIFLDRILLIDTVNSIIGVAHGVDDRNAFVLLGTPSDVIKELNTLIADKVAEARIDELNVFEAQLHNNHNGMPIGSPSQYVSEQKNLRINQLQHPAKPEDNISKGE